MLFHCLANNDNMQSISLTVKRSFVMNKNKIVMFAGSQGGHYVELMGLKSLFPKYNSILVTDNFNATFDNKELCVFKAIEHSTGMAENRAKRAGSSMKQGRLSALFGYLKMFRECWSICRKWKPTVIVTTGSYIAVPLFLCGKLYGSKTIFIESNAKVYNKTMTGILVERFSDKIYVQWPEMLELYPKAEYYGTLM